MPDMRICQPKCLECSLFHVLCNGVVRHLSPTMQKMLRMIHKGSFLHSAQLLASNLRVRMKLRPLHREQVFEGECCSQTTELEGGLSIACQKAHAQHGPSIVPF